MDSLFPRLLLLVSVLFPETPSPSTLDDVSRGFIPTIELLFPQLLVLLERNFLRLKEGSTVLDSCGPAGSVLSKYLEIVLKCNKLARVSVWKLKSNSLEFYEGADEALTDFIGLPARTKYYGPVAEGNHANFNEVWALWLNKDM